MKNFLRTDRTRIISKDNAPVHLKGVNLGGWLMMEAYILHAPNYPEQKFKKEFARALGNNALKDFERKFRENFIREDDIRNIARAGFNCVRVPFHYRLVETAPYRYDNEGLRFLDRAVRWSKKYKVWAILDCHAAPGAQNCDWHADSHGKAELWTKKSNRDRALSLWEFLADRYKNEEYVAGYDLLNETVLKNAKPLNDFYKRLIQRIRAVDPNHILFIEGNKWATDLECLEPYDDGNYVLSVHNYEPLAFTFNFVPHLSYPLRSSEGGWNKAVIRRNLARYERISRKRKVPVFVGEFGVNGRCGHFGEDRWVADMTECFNDFGFHWTYWTYKAVQGSVFLDGIYTYVDNPPWVNRPGPLRGWDTYKQVWPKHKKAMVRSWQTDRFQVNKKILKVLKNALR